MQILQRLWTGIVAAVAGVSLALVVQILGQMTIGLPLDYLSWILLICGTIGFILGVVIGPRKTRD